jgi:ABC-type Zn uptake system ZnuABC Zn-binding protein ZnuA
MAAFASLTRRGALAGAALPALFARRAHAADSKVLVITGLQSTFSIARALAKDTSIEVQAAFPPDIGMEEQASYLSKKRRADFIAAAKRADAAITIRRIWNLDPLFSAVRAQNIRAIEIDASTPFAPEMAGVALLETAKMQGADGEHRPGTVSPYIWLSLTNVVRMTDIIAADLRRLSEADAQTIDRNQQKFRASILALRTQFDGKLADIDNPSVILLKSDLGYLMTDLGVDITASFAKSEYDWTDADVKTLLDKMAKSGTLAIVAAHKPKDTIATAIKGAGGRLAVLNLIDIGVADQDGRLDADGLLKVTRGNLDALLTALPG